MAFGWFLFVPAFPMPQTADNHSLLDLNRFPGSQNADNGPYSSSSQGLRRETRQLTTGQGSYGLKQLLLERLPDCISNDETLALRVLGKDDCIRFKDSYLMSFYSPA